MELTGRRFAAFMAIGLSMAVVLGIVVWKLPDPGVGIASDRSEFAGQPVAAADKSTEKNTGENPTEPDPASASNSTQHSDNNRDRRTPSSPAEEIVASPRWTSGAQRDPLAPPNAKLDGTEGNNSREHVTDMYRPSNAVPAEAQAERRDSGERTEDSSRSESKDTSRTETTSRTPTVVEETPSEPKPGNTAKDPGAVPAEGTPSPAVEQAGEDTWGINTTDAEELLGIPSNKVADKAADKADAISPTVVDPTNPTGATDSAPQVDKDSAANDGAESEKRPRPEDPFSASEREAQTP